MEELILVTGCTLVDAWAAAAFVGRTEMAEISLAASRTPDKSDIRFECRSIQGDVAQHYNDFDSKRFPRSVYSPYTDFFLRRIKE
jgi:hypothetical protein